MKRIIITIIIGLTACSTLIAQERLHIESLFDGQYSHRKDAIEVLVKGKKLKPYNLTLFRSLTLKGDTAACRQIEQIVRKDTPAAVDKEVGKIGGRLYYGFYRFPQQDKKFRYLFFKNSTLRTPQQPEITVVYMEGYASLEELKKMFK